MWENSNSANGYGNSSSLSGPSILESSDWPLVVKICVSILLAITLVFTILGNTVTIAVLASWVSAKQFFNTHMVISLAIADLLVGITVVPCALDSVVSGEWRCGSFWGKFNGFGNFFFCISSIMHLMSLSLDRYVAVFYPLLYSQIVTKVRSILICVGLWAYSAIWAMLPLFNISSYECFISYIGTPCKREDWSGQSNSALLFAILVVSGTYGVALIVICFTYFKILLVIFKQVRKINECPKSVAASENGNQLNVENRKTSKMSSRKGVFTLLSVIIVYLCSWSPYCILTLIEIAEKKKLSSTAGMLTMFVGFANSMCNPIIYAIKYKKFRFKMFKLLGIKKFTMERPSSFVQPPTRTTNCCVSVSRLRP